MKLAALALATLIAIDGDTLRVLETREVLRLTEIDAPEIFSTAGCGTPAASHAVLDRGYAAMGRLQRLVNYGEPTITRLGKDRYGRTLAKVEVRGVDVAKALVAGGYARPWEGRRKSWCQ